MVFAKALAFGFKIIGGDVERFHQRQGRILRRLHLSFLSLDATGHEVGIDWRERMRDDHVDRQIEHVEHRARRRLGIFTDGEALAVAVTNNAF